MIQVTTKQLIKAMEKKKDFLVHKQEYEKAALIRSAVDSLRAFVDYKPRKDQIIFTSAYETVNLVATRLTPGSPTIGWQMLKATGAFDK